MSERLDQFCDVAAALRTWMIGVSGTERIHQDHVPQAPSRGPCQLDQPYIWFSRADVQTELCLGAVHHEAIGPVANIGPQEETFDVEIWASEMEDAQRIARQFHEASPYQGMLNGEKGQTSKRGTQDLVFAQLLQVIGQSDQYIYRGIDEGYARGGAQSVAFQIELDPCCLR